MHGVFCKTIFVRVYHVHFVAVLVVFRSCGKKSFICVQNLFHSVCVCVFFLQVSTCTCIALYGFILFVRCLFSICASCEAFCWYEAKLHKTLLVILFFFLNYIWIVVSVFFCVIRISLWLVMNFAPSECVFYATRNVIGYFHYLLPFLVSSFLLHI
jgi:hypothetical protein